MFTEFCSFIVFSLKNSNNSLRCVNFERSRITPVLMLLLFVGLTVRKTVKEKLTNFQQQLLIYINPFVASLGHVKVCESSQN